ncbi:MAG: phosphatidylglycerophosphatase A [Bacteroidales bacterium]|nr:phosphatidylglycerophosphatase A [Bacteroidales bacterium]
MRIHKLIATGLGTGYAPLAPGTAGAALGIVIFYLLNLGFTQMKLNEPIILVSNLVVILIVMLLGVFSIKKVHQIWEHDAQKIVIDEVIGVWIAVFALPFQWQFYLAAFVLFRFFDILKPLYIRKLDNLKTDWSVMLDDVLAGVYANLILQLIVVLKIF